MKALSRMTHLSSEKSKNPPRLNIVTPCSRPQNLPRIARSIIRGFVNHGWHGEMGGTLGVLAVRWWVVFDMNSLSLNKVNQGCLSISDGRFSALNPTFLFNDKKGEAGHQHRNMVLEILEERNESGWYYNVDDDNILHEKFWEVGIELKRNSTAIAVNQVLRNGEPRFSPVVHVPLEAKPENMKLCFVDTAQVIFNLEKIKGRKFDSSRYDADGLFIESLFNDDDDFVFINKDLSYYNYLS